MNQIANRRADPKPLTIYKIVLTITLVVVVFSGGGMIVNSFRRLQKVRETDLPLEKIADSIGYLGATLGASTRMATVTGEPQWEEQHQTYANELREAFQKAETLTDDPELLDSIERVRETGDRLIEIESGAFEQVRQGDLEEAAKILQETRYVSLKMDYAEQAKQLTGDFQGEVEQDMHNLHNRTIDGIWLAVVVFSLVISLWFIAFRPMRRYYEEHGRIDHALRQSEERFRVLIQNIPVGVYRLTPGPQGRFIAANPAMVRMFGYDSQEDFLRADVKGLYADQTQRQAFSSRLRKESRVFGAELQLKRKDGTIIWGSVSANVIRDETGKILHVDGINEDITERKRAEESIRESERRYRLLAENTRDVILTLDMYLRITYISPAVLVLRGWTAEETMKQSLDQILAPSALQRVRNLMTQEVAGEMVERHPHAPARTVELEILCKDGSTVWTEAKVAFLRDEQRRPIGIQGSVRDVSDRKRAEEALRKSEALHRGIIETASEGVWLIDAANKTTFVNPNMASMLGYTPEEMIGRNLLTFLPTDSFVMAHENPSRRGPGRRVQSDVKFRRRDGSIFWAFVSATPSFDDHDNYIGSLGMITDITERKRAEEAVRESEKAYRLLAENATDVIWTRDLNLKLTYTSPSVFKLRGFTPEEAMNQSWEEIFPPDSLRLMRKLIALELSPGALKDGDPMRSVTLEMEVYHKDGSTIWTEMTLAFMRDARGRPIGIRGSTRDISQRRAAEEALRKSEELYRGIIETADEGVWIIDAESKTTFANAKLAEMIGYSAEELLGKSPYEFMDDESRTIAEANDRLRRTGVRTRNDLRFRRKDGGDLWVIASASPIFDKKESYLGALAMLTDITNRKRAEEGSRILAAVSSLFLSGRDFDMAVNTVLEMCGRFDGADRAFLIMLSDTENRMSKTHEWVQEGISSQIEKLQNMDASEFAWLLDQLRRGQSVVMPDVEVLPVGFRDHLKAQETQSRIVFPIMIDGNLEGFCGFDAVRSRRHWSPADVSVLRQTAETISRGIERRRAEEAIRDSETLYTSLVEHMSQMVWRKDQKGLLTFVNSQVCSFTGKSALQLIGKSGPEVLAPDLAVKYREEDERVLENGETVNAIHENRRHEGGLVFLQVVKTPVRDSHGDIIGLQGIAWDVTEQKKADEAFRAASRMEATATLAGGIAHDFNNLMVGILGNAELLQMDLSVKPDLLKRLKIIADSAKRGGDLAHQLLAYARGGKTQPTLINLHDPIIEALQLQERVIPHVIQLQSKLAGDLWPMVADPAQMTQIVMNLCINAVESIQGEGMITLTTENVLVDDTFVKGHEGLKPGPHVCLTVEDTGCGMSEETRARVFEPFFTTKFQGRGLGLAAIYGIVRNHHGIISIYSELGKGSVFKVYLPAAPTRPQPPPPAEPTTPRGTETILIVDDDPTILEVTEMMLERLGYKVLTAQSGTEALKIGKVHPGKIHLALLDMGMPGMDGSATFAELQKLLPELKVILCSGYTEDTAAQALLFRGAQGYLNKPFRIETLAVKIRQALKTA